MKVKHTSILIFLVYLMVLDIPYLSQTINNIIMLCCEALIIYELWNLKCLGKSIFENKSILVYLCVVLIATIVNMGISTRLMTALVIGIEYVLLFVAMKALIMIRGTSRTLNGILKITVWIVLIVDLCVIGTRGKGIGGSSILPYYLIGNKFAVSYLHMFFLGIFLCKHAISRNFIRRIITNIIVTAFCAFICYMVDCNTGIVGCIVIGSLTFLIGRKKKVSDFLLRPATYLIIFCGLTFLLVGTQVLLNNVSFQNIISNVFNRGVTWTGRLEMFQLTLQAFYKQPIWGYGINSTYVQQILGWGNAQNGILKIMLDTGIMGIISFLIVVYSVFYKARKKENMIKIFPIVSFLYGMAVCSTVEINISGLYFWALALVYNVKESRKDKQTYES